MCFLDITVQSPESTGYISLNQCKKRLSSPSALLWKGLPCPPLSSPPITHIHPSNSLYPIAMKYTKFKRKSASSCKTGTIKFTSYFHSNTPGKHSVSFDLWAKHTPAVLTFMKNLHWALSFLRNLNFSLSLTPKYTNQLKAKNSQNHNPEESLCKADQKETQVWSFCFESLL